MVSYFRNFTKFGLQNPKKNTIKQLKFSFMKKITLLLFFIFFSITGYSQLTEGFENTTGPDALPSTNWTLGSGNWAVFDNAVGTAQRWGNAPVAIPSNAYQGDNAAYINRENLGTEGLISQDYLATPLVTIPANGQLRFFARSFTSGNQGTLYQIRVAPATASQTNPAAYTTLVQQWDETTLNTTFNVYEEKIVDLTAFATQQVYVSFVRVHTQLPGGINGAGDRWLVDNVNIVQRCLDPTTLTFSAVTQNGASLNWANPSGATSWEIEVILATATPTGTGVIYNGTLPYVVTGLLANTAYKFYVRAICSTGYSSAWAGPSANFTTGTAPPECGGNFVDAGGTTANYPNNSNSTTTICPTVPGEKVTVTFTAFNTEATFDGLYVYDGNGVVPANLIASANPAGNVPGGLAGSYWGTTIPGPFTSSAADGCLTFVFRSDGSVNNPGWVSNITCAPPPVCQQPTTLVSSAVTSNSATLAWTNVGVATTWEVIALPCTAPAPNASTTGFIATNTNPYTFTGLASATCYNLYVRGNCSSTSNGVSAWSGPRTVTTLVAPPECGGNFVDAGGPTANYPNNSNTTTIICPTNPGDVVTVTFTSFNTEANWDGLYVYDGNGVVPANLIASANPAANVPGGLAGSYWGTTIPGPFTSSAADGCLTFVFRSDGAVNNPGWVSNITCAPPPPCQQPTGLVSSAVTSNSATLAWTNVGVATTWEVIALPCTDPAPNASTTGFIATNTNPYVFTSLTPATCYNLYVRGNCSSTSNGVSAWSGPRTITTELAPPVCGGTFVDAGGPTANYPNNSNITTTICPTNPGEIVTVTFTSFNTEANWDGLYVYDGNGVVPANLIASANPAANVPGGLAGSYWGTTIPGPFSSSTVDGCLTFVFRSDGAVNNPGWVANVTCGPAPNCQKPISLTATDITSTSALLGWTEPNSSVIQWEVIILPFGSPAPTQSATGTIVTVNPAQFTGLNPGTQYTYYVRGICPTSGTSAWSNGFNFNTLVINDNCSGAIFAPVNQSSICQQVTAGTLTGATASLPAPAAPCVGTADDDVWFQFVASNPFLTVSLQNIVGPTTNLNFAVYSGNCGTLTQVFCSAAFTTSGVVNGLTIGQTYYIRVYSNANTPQNVNFNLCISTPASCVSGQAACQNLSYQNTTGVASQGTIGCLSSSPNPTYYTINVNQTGPINLLLTQSTFPTVNGVPGTPNLDVDYAAWGPFNSQTAACAAIGNPPTLAPGIGVPVTTTTGCSFSAAPIENLNIVNAVAGQIYVILITNFSNNPGFISLTQTNFTSPGAGQYQCCPDAFFTYNPVSYCKTPGAPNPLAVVSLGSTAGVFSLSPASPTGLVFANTATGEIDLAASVPGNYLVLNTVAATASCIQQQRGYNISIVAPTSATISYGPTALTSFCKSNTAIQNVTLTGTTGGNFSVNPNGGLSIDTSTGAINPSLSAPGIYTITYNLPGSTVCNAANPQATVEILPIPNIIQPGPISGCGSTTLPALTVGNYYSQPGGLGTPLDPTIPLTTSQTVYIYAINANGCFNEKSFTVTINSIPGPIQITQTVSSCNSPTGTITVTNPTSVAGSPAGNLFISEVTDAGVGSLSYIELFNGTGATVNLANYRLRVYYNGSPTLQTTSDLLLSGTMPNNTVKVIAIGSTANQGGVVPNLVFASCNGVNNNDNIILTTTTGTVIDNWGATDGSVYTPNGGGYVYRRNASATHPSTTWNPADWTAIVPEEYNNVGSYLLFDSNYEYSIDNGAFQSNPLFTGLAGGPHTLVVKDTITNCTSSINVTIDVIGGSTLTSLTGVSPVCSGGDAVFTLTGTPNATVTYTINSGANQTVVLDSAGNATVTITAITADTVFLASQISLTGCDVPINNTATVAITLNPAITSLSATTPVCSGGNAEFSLSGTPNASVTYTINGGADQTVVLDATGNGTVTITAVTANTTILLSQISLGTCNATITDTATVVVNPNPTFVNLSAITPICTGGNAVFSLSGTPNATVTYTINSGANQTVVLNAAGNATVTINNVTANTTILLSQISLASCTTSISNTASVVVNPNPTFGNLTATTPVCSGGNAVFGLTGTPNATVTYTINSGANQTVVLDVTGNGTVTINNVTANTVILLSQISVAGCNTTLSNTATVVVNPLPQVVIAGDCVGSAYTLTANPVDGSFDPLTATYSWEDSSGNPIGGNTQSIIVTQQGEYTVNVFSVGCPGSAMFSADDIACVIQKGISVNNDGKNDTLDLTGFNVKNLSIFNRYGEKVYTYQNYTNQWGGQSNNGDELPDGTYYYVINRDNGETRTGWVYINRAQ